MTLTIDLTQEEEAQIEVVASMRGMKPEEHAYTLLSNLLRSVPLVKPERLADQDERERLIDAAKAGDKEARLTLLHMPPLVPTHDPVTGEPLPSIPDEALRRENIYEDRA